jgi:hypothetical protein
MMKMMKRRSGWPTLMVAIASTMVIASAHSTVAQAGPGRSKYEPITVDRGVTHDGGFGQWSDRGSASNSKAAPGTGGARYDTVPVDRGVTHDPGFGRWNGGGSVSKFKDSSILSGGGRDTLSIIRKPH